MCILRIIKLYQMLIVLIKLKRSLKHLKMFISLILGKELILC